VRYIGKSAWQISAWPDVEYPQLANVTRARELATACGRYVQAAPPGQA